MQISGSLNITGSDDVIAVRGNTGALFTVSDELSGSLFRVNTEAGVPAFEVKSDYSVGLGLNASTIETREDGTVKIGNGPWYNTKPELHNGYGGSLIIGDCFAHLKGAPTLNPTLGVGLAVRGSVFLEGENAALYINNQFDSFASGLVEWTEAESSGNNHENGAGWATPMIYRSKNSGGSFPFNQYGELIIQGNSYGAAYQNGISFVTAATADFENPAIRMRVAPDGNVGIGTDNPDVLLEVSGAAAFNDITSNYISNDDENENYFKIFSYSFNPVSVYSHTLCHIKVMQSGGTDGNMGMAELLVNCKQQALGESAIVEVIYNFTNRYNGGSGAEDIMDFRAYYDPAGVEAGVGKIDIYVKRITDFGIIYLFSDTAGISGKLSMTDTGAESAPTSTVSIDSAGEHYVAGQA